MKFWRRDQPDRCQDSPAGKRIHGHFNYVDHLLTIFSLLHRAIFSFEFQRQNNYQYEAMCHVSKRINFGTPSNRKNNHTTICQYVLQDVRCCMSSAIARANFVK